MDENQQPAGDGQGQPDSLQDRLSQTNQSPPPAQPPAEPVNQQPQGAPQTGPTEPVNQQSQTPPAQEPVAQPTPEPRTMEGDLNQPQTPPAQEPAFNPAGMEDGGPVFTPETDNQMGGSLVEPEIKTGGSKAIWWILGIVVGVVILGLVGYFIVYPILTPGDTVPAQPTPTTTPPVVEVPKVGHTSAFKIDPFSRITASVGDEVTEANITALLLREGEQTPVDGVVEIILQDNAGVGVKFSDFLSVVAPSVTANTQIGELFEDDFTMFLYRGEEGSLWPGYVASLKTDADPSLLNVWFSDLEGSQLSELFLTDPGEFAAFRNGTALGIADRYTPGSTPGASFGYLANENKVLMSTSFGGMRSAILLIGWVQ